MLMRMTEHMFIFAKSTESHESLLWRGKKIGTGNDVKKTKTSENVAAISFL